jgi:hypothetical protein
LSRLEFSSHARSRPGRPGQSPARGPPPPHHPRLDCQELARWRAPALRRWRRFPDRSSWRRVSFLNPSRRLANRPNPSCRDAIRLIPSRRLASRVSPSRRRAIRLIPSRRLAIRPIPSRRRASPLSSSRRREDEPYSSAGRLRPSGCSPRTGRRPSFREARSCGCAPARPPVRPRMPGPLSAAYVSSAIATFDAPAG